MNQHYRSRMVAVTAILFGLGALQAADKQTTEFLQWERLPDLPGGRGVAGAFTGVHNDVLIVAGGANFSQPVWEGEKEWHDAIYVLRKTADGYRWQGAGSLPRAIAYGATVSTPAGIVCIGGNDAQSTFRDVFLLQWDPIEEDVAIRTLPDLPEPRAYASATEVEDVVFLCGGQSDPSLDSATNTLWSLDLAQRDLASQFAWRSHPPCPGPPRAFHLSASQYDGYHESLYIISGRRQTAAGPEFLRDLWAYTPTTGEWRERQAAPQSVMAGTAVALGQSHIMVLGGADGSLFGHAEELRDNHPGFPKTAYSYHAITDAWTVAGTTPANHVTTTAVRWGDAIILASGEVRPRVRSPHVWRITPQATKANFGAVNYTVLFSYLAAMVGVGLYFTQRNKDTNDYFRGGKQIPWWAAGCSIFATMLSSLTYTGVPAKSFAQDWVYAVGNFMIPIVAIAAVFVALPFFRRIDATSAYEYLEKRFNRAVRLFGSASFTLFHLFRMAVVMSLTGLAIAVATPLTPAQSVLLMGILSIIYCTMGGIEAVIWTDTIQTFVLLGGALIAFLLLVAGTDGGLGGFYSTATAADKFSMANFHWDVTSSQTALWVIVVGAIGQNLSSYTADQAVVQRYMTTTDQRRAARSIWTNAVLTIPATLLFFGMGTALYAYYRSHPEKLDPTMTTDQIFPLFIARDMPVGLAGLIVAGVFAAAQSTVSTSMNSTATTIVTDFMRPINACRSEAAYLRAARLFTFLIGVLGTLLGLIFVDPQIKSLFDTFIIVIGLFMGVLGGLFVLGALTRRANGPGALIGAVAGAAVMFSLWRFTSVNGYLYTASGIASCFTFGYLASLCIPSQPTNLKGLTIYTTGALDESGVA